MVSEKLKEWVKQKRKEGVSDERIKKSLEETGHDPSIVDELENPFDNSDVDTDGVSENLFEGGSSPEDSTQREDEETSTGTSDGENVETRKTGPGGREDEGLKYATQETDTADSEEEDETGVLEYLKSLKPGLPSYSLNPKLLAALLIIAVLGSGGYYAYDSGIFTRLTAPGSVSGETQQQLSELEARYQGCPNAGIRINSVSASNGQTVANVLVTRNEVRVVLEVRENGELIGFTTDKLKGEKQITVDAVGDKAVLRKLGCQRDYSRRNY